MENAKTEKAFDIIITVLYSLFLLSLTNSIFINQIGYFGALTFILIKFFVVKKNPFVKTGLEFAFLFFIVAMIFSTLFSADIGSSFQNFLKRVLLIPVLYTTLVFCSDGKKIKYAAYFFLGFATISLIIYVIFAVEHYLSNLYGVQQSGPGLFHYPITTSEIISFVVVIFFAFLINEKGNLKKRLLYFALFILSAIALIATYKRTGWIGAFAGIIFIIILNRKYLYLAVLSVVIILAFLLDTSSSRVIVLDLKDPVSPYQVFETEGRAQSILPHNNYGKDFLLSDYENGLVEYNNFKAVSKSKFPAPVNESFKINDSLGLTYLADTRFFLHELNNNSKGNRKEPVKLEEFISPGYTVDYKLFENSLAVLDKDSGLTVFPDISNKSEIHRTLLDEEYMRMGLDSMRIVLLAPGKSVFILTIHETSAKIPVTSDFIFLKDNILYLSNSDGLKTYSIFNCSIIPTDSSKTIRNIRYATFNERFIFFADGAGKLFSIARRNDGIIKPGFEVSLLEPINSLAANDSYVFLTSQKQSRLRSIFDPYNISNATRLQLWNAGLKMLADHPLFGVGDIDLANLYKRYKNYYDKEIQGHLHNNFFHILAIFGIIGFLTFIYMMLRIIVLNYRTYKQAGNTEFYSSLSLGINGSFIAFLVSGFTEWNFGDHEIITMVWFLTGLNIAIAKLLSLQSAKNNNSEN